MDKAAATSISEVARESADPENSAEKIFLIRKMRLCVEKYPHAGKRHEACLITAASQPSLQIVNFSGYMRT